MNGEHGNVGKASSGLCVEEIIWVDGFARTKMTDGGMTCWWAGNYTAILFVDASGEM